MRFKALTEKQIVQIHEQTILLLSKKGVAMTDISAREVFLRNGATVKGEHVLIPEKLIGQALQDAPSSFTVRARNRDRDVLIGHGLKAVHSTAAGVPFILDSSGERRNATFEDFKDMLKLTQTSPVVQVGCCGALYPDHFRKQQALCLQMYYTLLMTDKPVVGLSEDEHISGMSIDMIERTLGTNDETVSIAICNSLSPMKWDKKMLDSIRVYAERGQAINISCCSMAGATSPIYLAGCVLEANAEILAGITYAQLIRPGTPVIYGTTSSVIDMSNLSLVLGTPEYSLISSACAQMAAHYRLPYRSGGGLTDAKDVDAQAGMESVMNHRMSADIGINFILQSVGVLESFMTVSFEKWILDEETLLRLRFLDRGIEEFQEDLWSVIADGAESGGFLMAESTVAQMKSELYWPMVTDRRGYDAYGKGGKSFKDLLTEKVKSRLESYREPVIEPEARERLERITESFMRILA